MRAVLDANVVISGMISPEGACAEILRRWEFGEFEFVTSKTLLQEIERILAYPKLRKYLADDRSATLSWLRRSVCLEIDPRKNPSINSRDPKDNYLIALAADQQALLVSGDNDLLELRATMPIYDPAGFVEVLKARERK